MTENAAAETGSPKHNMRFADTVWRPVAERVERLQADGVKVDMTAIARHAYLEFMALSDAEVAERFGTRVGADA